LEVEAVEPVQDEKKTAAMEEGVECCGQEAATELLHPLEEVVEEVLTAYLSLEEAVVLGLDLEVVVVRPRAHDCL